MLNRKHSTPLSIAPSLVFIINWRMDFIYGVIYYLLVTLLGVVFLLPLFFFKWIRRRVFNWAGRTGFVNRLNLFGNLPFAVLVLAVYVVVDSLLSYWKSSSVINDNHLIQVARSDNLL